MEGADETNEIEGTVEAKPSEYVKDLLREKMTLNPEEHPHSLRLVDDEILKAQAQTHGGKPYRPDARYVDIYKEKPIKVTAKVLVPVKEHPRFNFVGKLLGPKGNSLKRLQEETMTKMAILGRGSMRDKTKEEELRTSLDPKYSHLSEELHVEIQALGPPAEAYARIAFALAEIRKFLVPDGNDEIRQEQLREIQQYGGAGPRGRGGPIPGVGRGGMPSPAGRGAPRAPLLPPGPRMPPPPPAGLGRPPIGKTKVLSILDRARAAMEDTYPPTGYEEPAYYDPGSQVGNFEGGGFGGPPQSYNGSNYYESTFGGNMGGGEPGGGWKPYSAGGASDKQGGGGKAQSGGASRFGANRSAPYNRPK